MLNKCCGLKGGLNIVILVDHATLIWYNLYVNDMLKIT